MSGLSIHQGYLVDLILFALEGNVSSFWPNFKLHIVAVFKLLFFCLFLFFLIVFMSTVALSRMSLWWAAYLRLYEERVFWLFGLYGVRKLGLWRQIWSAVCWKKNPNYTLIYVFIYASHPYTWVHVSVEARGEAQIHNQKCSLPRSSCLRGKYFSYWVISPASHPFFSLTVLRQLVAFRVKDLVGPIGCTWQWSVQFYPLECLYFSSCLSLFEFTPGITHFNCDPMLVSCHLKKSWFEGKLMGSGRFMVKVSKHKEGGCQEQRWSLLEAASTRITQGAMESWGGQA